VARLGEREATSDDTIRLESIARQIDRLLVRAVYARNAVLSYLGGVGLFVLTSLLIGADFFSGVLELRHAILTAFLAGIVAMMAGVIYGILDTRKAYEVIRYDVMVDQ
jgi:membrane associated rhomboid family serine protease